MREILFRGKRTDNGELSYGYYVKSGVNHIIYENDYPIDVYPETVGQYTGLKDKNGVRIFEGDIVRDLRDNVGIIEWHSVFLRWDITFTKGEVRLLGGSPNKMYAWTYPKMYLEVIGNRWDNPELFTGD